MMAKILVIDDEEIIRERLKSLLTLDEYEVCVAEDGPKGLEVFQSESPQVVLLDIKMPGMDGIEVLQRLKKSAPDTEVIIITGHGGIETAIQALREGAFDYVNKPIEYDELVLSLKRALERRQLREQLSQHVKDLERANQELRHKQAQLIQAEKMAAIGTLAAGVAHEINNPLTAITMNTAFLLEALKGDESKFKKLRIIEKQADRAVEIVKGLLTFSRKGSESKKILSDIHQIIEDALKPVEHQMALGNIKLAREFGSDLPALLVNPNQIQQVFLNIITNARDAMLDGGQLTIKTRRFSLPLEGGGLGGGDFTPSRIDPSPPPLPQGERAFREVVAGGVVVEFSDTGQGIPAEELSKIFDPFYTTKKPGQGTGLGLYISYEIIKSHNGEIVVKSEVGKGATFTITLPAHI
ncbi:MAG: response regulator [Elusimicrobia bacterium]|nr:response regulator [Elusimicrobiota bacterium]